jgi:hypothetical protein
MSELDVRCWSQGKKEKEKFGDLFVDGMII